MILQSYDEKTRKEFLKILGHELRNSMAAIQSTVELMKAREMNAMERLEQLNIIDDQMHAMANVLSDHIDFSRVTGDKFKTQLPFSSTNELSTIDRNKEARGVGKKMSPRENVLKVLLVDDNEIVADSLSGLLSLRGYEVEVAYNGTQAIEKALTFRPQVAILDIGMPDLDGYEVVGRIREQKFPCTYIAVTGYGQSCDKKEAGAAGFDYHLTKPAGIKEIDAILQKSRVRSENVVDSEK